MDKAHEDLPAAEALLSTDHLAPSMFHAQQSMEKSLKALLFEREGRFPRIHDLVVLADACKAPRDVVDAYRTVSPAYTQVRYPDTTLIVSDEQAASFIAHAKEVVEWVLRRLS